MQTNLCLNGTIIMFFYYIIIFGGKHKYLLNLCFLNNFCVNK